MTCDHENFTVEYDAEDEPRAECHDCGEKGIVDEFEQFAITTGVRVKFKDENRGEGQ